MSSATTMLLPTSCQNLAPTEQRSLQESSSTSYINTSTLVEVDLVPQETNRVVMMIEVDWRTTFIDYIKDQVLPLGIKKDVAEAVRIMRRSKNYVLVDDKLYK